MARRLVSVGHDPAGIQVTAFGGFRPIDGNETAEGRARNRRVELFYSRRSIEDALLAGAQPGTESNQRMPDAAHGRRRLRPVSPELTTVRTGVTMR